MRSEGALGRVVDEDAGDSTVTEETAQDMTFSLSSSYLAFHQDWPAIYLGCYGSQKKGCTRARVDVRREKSDVKYHSAVVVDR